MTRALIHTPGTHLARLDKVDLKISPARGHYMIRLRYRHVNDKVHEASIVQHVLWSPPDSPVCIPEMGAHIMSRIFSHAAPQHPERKASFWLRYSIHDAIQHLQNYIGAVFEVTVESRQHLGNNEYYPNLKYAYYKPGN